MHKVNVRRLVIVASLIALTIVLDRLILPVNLPTIRISLAFIPMMCCGMLFGPVWGGAAYGIADILGWPLMGLPPIPLILFSRVAEGSIYGLILHRESTKFLPHAVLTALTTQIICSAGLTTLGLSLFFAAPYLPLLISRLAQILIIAALQLAVYPVLVRLKEVLRKSGILLQ